MNDSHRRVAPLSLEFSNGCAGNYQVSVPLLCPNVSLFKPVLVHHRNEQVAQRCVVVHLDELTVIEPAASKDRRHVFCIVHVRVAEVAAEQD